MKAFPDSLWFHLSQWHSQNEVLQLKNLCWIQADFFLQRNSPTQLSVLTVPEKPVSWNAPVVILVLTRCSVPRETLIYEYARNVVNC